ncbi:MAG: dTDP-4-dehydrorhamnose reductase [Gammaproteobacteria bacterium]|nr:dTDP-4-dehydrorhamnose reductase [Gammaproteobacteria bacterium]
MSVVVLGRNGQVARSLRERLPDALFLGREQLDLEDLEGIEDRIVAERPSFIINAAAYTAVDKAEEDVERAWRVNAHAVKAVAAAARSLAVPLLHLSTDYVFSGKGFAPYGEADPPEPLSQYGGSKLAGEREVLAGSGACHYVLRTSWVFSEFGSNFVRTMLELGATRDSLRIVADQYGRPTYAGDVADVVAAMLARWQAGHPLESGCYHFASEGVTSWYQFALAIFEDAGNLGLIERLPLVEPIATADYPTPAPRPLRSVLDTRRLESALSWQPRPWREGLGTALNALVATPRSPGHSDEAPGATRSASPPPAALPMKRSTSATAQAEERFLVFGAPQIEEEDIAEVVACLRSGWLGTGPRVAQFEAAFRAYRGAQHAVAVNSCSAALHVSLLASGLEPGDEVITSAMTFCATVNAIVHAGLVPVLADIDPVTMNLDPADVRKKLTARTRALLPVHFAGRPCDMRALCVIADQHELKVIEDCAHAIEATFDGQAVGTFGEAGCFSFYVTKNITTGEGGMVLLKDAAAQARIKTLALNGLSKDAWNRFGADGYAHYDVMESGFKYNMTDMAAALGLRQLGRIEASWQRRQAIWEQYQQAFADLPVTRPAEPDANMRHAYHLFPILVEEAHCGLSRDRFIALMTARGVGVGVHYRSLPEHPYFRRRFGWQPENYPHASHIGRSTVSLPLSAGMSGEDVARVIAAVVEIVSPAAAVRSSM